MFILRNSDVGYRDWVWREYSVLPFTSWKYNCSRQSVGKSGMVPEGTLEEIGVPISLADPRRGQHSVKKKRWGGGGVRADFNHLSQKSSMPELVAIGSMVPARTTAEFKRLIRSASHWKSRLFSFSFFLLRLLVHSVYAEQTTDKRARASFQSLTVTQTRTENDTGCKTDKGRWKVQ